MPLATGDTERPMVAPPEEMVALFRVLPEETMAPMSELKENGVTLRPKEDEGPVKVAQKGSSGAVHLWLMFSPTKQRHPRQR